VEPVSVLVKENDALVLAVLVGGEEVMMVSGAIMSND
jgi:hypothetical protein